MKQQDAVSGVRCHEQGLELSRLIDASRQIQEPEGLQLELRDSSSQ